MTKKVVHGIDASWRNLAIVTIYEDEDYREIVDQKVLTSKLVEGQDPAERLDTLGTQFVQYIGQYESQVTLIEGYAMGFGANSSSKDMLAELGGHLKWLLWKAGHKVISVPPNTLKMWVCGKGKGNAQKDTMMMHTYKRWGFEAPNNDICDAFGLAKLAQASLQPSKEVLSLLQGCPGAPNYMPKKKSRKKKGVEE